MDVHILSSIISEHYCPSCKEEKLQLHEKLIEKKGLASLLFLHCNCGYEREFRTSKQCREKFYDINTRMVYAMRSIKSIPQSKNLTL